MFGFSPLGLALTLTGITLRRSRLVTYFVRLHVHAGSYGHAKNRQIDVWEIAFVWAYPVERKLKMAGIEAALFHHFDPISKLMNGAIPNQPDPPIAIPDPIQIVQVMSDNELTEKKDPAQRLPRQAEHYAQIVGHFLAVKNSNQIARAMHAHFERLSRYHDSMLDLETQDD